MKIALLTMGTRGDVQPFAVLGKTLQQHGHEVTLSTAKNFTSLVGSYGLNFAPVEADFQEILNSEEGKKMMSNPFSAGKHLDRLIYPMIYDSLKTFYHVALKNDKVLFHVKAMADYFVEHMPGKLVRANVVPAIQSTREFVNPVISSFPLPAIMNRLSYKLSDLGMRMMSKPVTNFRKEIGINTSYRKPLLPSLYGISPTFLNKPKDYPSNAYYTGFWMENTASELPTEIRDFIVQGSAPLLITFGSMPFESRMNLPATLKKLVTKLKTRLLVVKGWGLADTEAIEENDHIKLIDDAPYDKLFPHVKAVIHHGGIGTVAACVKAGKPFMTCPVLYPLGDQHFWGMVAFEKGIALKPIPLKKMNEEKFIDNAKNLLGSEQLYVKARALMNKIKLEDGVSTAVQLIERGVV